MKASLVNPSQSQARLIRQPPSLVPSIIIFLAGALLLGWVIVSSGGDPLALARLGTRYSEGIQGGTEGYDGQFVYYIARDPHPERVAKHLDEPAYRYQRILLPLTARILSAGNVQVIPWVLAVVGLLAHAAGVWAVGELLAGWGTSRWYALAYGLFPGFALALRLDLPEPMAYALVAGAVLARDRKREGWSALLFELALFAKEVTGVFLAAQLLADLLNRRWRSMVRLLLVAGLPYLIFQIWLWSVFGRPGLGSGGAMATPFEVIPLMGIIRIGFVSPLYLVAMLVVFGPAILLPSGWGLWSAVKRGISGDLNVVVLGLLLNAALILFLPYSTFRETGGLLRFSCGLALAAILFAGRYQVRRVLNYSFLWFALNAFLFKA